MSAAKLPAKAPRGKVFAVVRASHVVDGLTKVRPVLARSGWLAREEATSFAMSIDYRLTPMVMLIDKRPEHAS